MPAGPVTAGLSANGPGLSASAVVVAATVNGSPLYFRNLERVWDLVGDEFAYKAYVINEVEEMVEQGS